MKRSISLRRWAVAVLVLIGVAVWADDGKQRSIVGVWMLESETAPDGRETHSIYTQYTRCKIYDADSTYYTVQLHAVGSEALRLLSQ